MKVLYGGGKVSLVCTQANLDESGAGDYNVIFREKFYDFKFSI